MVYFLFFIAACFTIFLAVQLSKHADIIGEKSTLNAAVLGLMLGGATSLPEITTSVTSIFIENPDIATGNVLGSNLFNLLILALVDLWYRNKQIFNYSSKENGYTNVLVMTLSSIIFISLYIRVPNHFFSIGIDTIVLISVYILGIVLLSKVKKPQLEVEVQGETTKYAHESLKKSVRTFILTAFLILLFGTLLTITADQIATLTGIEASFIGSFLVAASTSLPEAVSIVVAVRLANYGLAIGSILGSNIFNILILVFTDVMFRSGSLLFYSSPSHIYTVLGTLILSIITYYAILRERSINKVTYVLPSLFVVICYFITSYVIFSKL
ncbi:sodium:calcium antiporter [Bacillus sp. SM2101]|uniref:sodium:calcium antiporter n=1 Tax=Bacillus sp. SM2101 TaxID=2805366 RepID=UPI001BDE71CA|nr:sodium:calcium antiporter [Bacillus sp. SM2101]